MIKKYSLVFVAFLCFVLSGFGQAIFTNPITDTNPSATNPYTNGQIFDSNITVSGIGRGAGIGPNGGGDRYNANGWAGTSSEANAVSQNEFFYFTLSPNSGYKINFSSFLCRYQKSNASNSPTNYAIRSSVDAYTTNIATGELLATGEQTMSTIDISAANFQEIDSSITFRLYAWSSGSGTGTFSINDFTFNGTVTSTSTDEVDFCNLQFPRSATINLGESRDVYGQVYEDGVTPGDGQGLGIEAEIGYSASNTNPDTWTNWIPASYNPTCLDCNGGQNDEYFADLGSVITTGGTYYYATRFSLNSGPYTYGGILDDGSAGNFWDGATYVSGQLIVNGPSICFNENFSSITGGNNTTTGGSSSEWSGNVNFPTLLRAYQAGGAVKLGTGTNTGFITSRLLNEVSGDVTVNIMVKGWTTVEGNLLVTLNGVTEVLSYTQVMGGTFQEVSAVFNNVPAGSTLTISTSANRAFIDNIELICAPVIPQPELQLVDAGSINQNCGYTINYGNQALSANTDISFTIENIGSLDLDVTSLILTGTNSADYSIVSPVGGFTVAPAGSQTVTVRFTPSANGTRTATLTINNNDANESVCEVLLTGVGFTPAPNIRVERSTEALIANGAGPNTGNNTIFATTDLGNTSIPKLYYVRNGNASNPATANLTVNTISSSNNVEFTIINLPTLPITLAPNEFISFEIEFSPNSTTPITRNSIITATSNDNNNNPYTFDVQGTAGCPLYSGNIMPTSGPVGTEITITSAENLTGATATLNGDTLTTISSSVSELVVRVPLNITLGGAINVTLSNGCSFTNTFQLIDKAIQSCEGTGGSDPSALFISQVTDSGRDSVTYIELYNGTGITITDLSDYSLRIYNNGLANPLNVNYIIDLNNVSLPNGSTYTLALGTNVNGLQCISEHNFSNLADQQNADSGVSINFVKDDNFNIGHDHIRLYNNSAHIDSWGVYLNESWATSLNLQGKGANFQRRIDATLPNINYDNNDWIIQDWGNSCSDLDYSDIGVYDFSLGTPPTVSTLESPISNCDLSATLSITATEGFNGNNPLTYQWYYSAPGELGWTAVPDNDIYHDVTTNTLQILNTLTLDGYQYYCQVRENTVTCYTASNAIRLQVQKTTWDGNNWSPEPPDINTIAVIEGDYDTGNGTNGQTSFEACQMIVNSDYFLKISDEDNGSTTNTYIKVLNNIRNSGQIYVDAKAALVQVDDAGTFTLNGVTAKNTLSKFTHPLNYWYDYTYWSSPLENAQVETALFQSKANRRFYFDASNFNDVLAEIGNTGTFNPESDDIDDEGDDWVNQQTGHMTPGIGYAGTHNNDVPFTPGTSYQYIFEGTLANGGAFNTGDISVDIYINPSVGYNDWNFIGNPYPSAINAGIFFQHNLSILEGVIYLWSQSTNADANSPGNQNQNFSQNDYAVINYTGGVGTTSEASPNGSNIPNGFVPSGQGFFVIGKKTGAISGAAYYNENVFTNAMRETGNNTQFFRTEDTLQPNKLWVNLTSDNGVFNQILLGYIDGASDAYDGMHYDAPRNLSSGANSILYSIIPNSDKKFAIQAKNPNSLTLDEVIPLGFYTAINQATIYTLSIAQFEGDFFTSQTIFVKDNLLNQFHNLSTSDYTFTSEPGEYNDRFEIVFNEQALSVIENEIPASGLTIYELPSGHVKFSVGNALTIEAVTIIDMLGRTLYQLDGDNASEIYNLSNLSQATYVAKVTLSNGQTITKRAVKRL